MESRIRKFNDLTTSVNPGPGSNGLFGSSDGSLHYTTEAGDSEVVKSFVTAETVTFTETSGSGVYTGSITVPAGSFLLEVLVHGVAVWNNAGTVAMDVGDVALANGIFIITSLKSGGDLVAGETLGAAGVASSAGGEVGGDLTANTWLRRYLATERVISGVITTSSTGGSTGRTRMTVVYCTPNITTAATKV
jgi:hypothetical protein